MNNTADKRKTFVLNPHAVLSSSDSLLKFGEENEVVVPMGVLEQIQDTKKKLSFGKRKVAKDILDYVSTFKMVNLTGKGVIQKNGSVLKVSTNYHDTTVSVDGISDHDRRSLQVCIGLKNEGKNVIFITNNPVLRMKADKLGIKAEEFKDELFPLVKDQYKGRADVTTTKEWIDYLYKNGSIEKEVISDWEKIEWNANLFLNISSYDDNSSTLAKYDGEKIVLLEHKISPFGITPKNTGQRFLIEALMSDAPLVVVKGGAGTGKTFCSLAAGIQLSKVNKYKQILVTRPMQTVSNEEIGFLPGDIDEKVSPYLGGIRDNLDIIGHMSSKDDGKGQKRDADFYFKSGRIRIQPIGYIRGRTITDTYFIFDEVQNLDPEDVKTIVSRAGEGSKFVFLGDPSQVDNPKLNERFNGLVYLSEKMKGQKLCYQVTLGEEESVRGELSKLAIQLL